MLVPITLGTGVDGKALTMSPFHQARDHAISFMRWIPKEACPYHMFDRQDQLQGRRITSQTTAYITRP